MGRLRIIPEQEQAARPAFFVVLIIAYVMLFAFPASAAVLPYINDFELLTEKTDGDGQPYLIPNGGVGFILTDVDSFVEISTGAGTFVRVDPLQPRTFAKYVGLRDSEQYWSFVYVADSATGKATVFRVTTPTITIGSPGEGCQVSPCIPPAPFYTFAVVVERGRGALQYIGAR